VFVLDKLESADSLDVSAPRIDGALL